MQCCIQCGAPVVILFTNVECPTFGCRNYSRRTAQDVIINLYKKPRYKPDYISDIFLGKYHCDESMKSYDLWWDPYNDVIKARFGKLEDNQQWLAAKDIMQNFSFDDDYRALTEGAQRAVKYYRGQNYDKPTN